MIAPSSATASAPARIVRRLARNSGLVLGGQGIAGIFSLAYVAISARALGPHLFGVFSLILSFASGLAALMTFESANAVIRFGSTHLANGRRDRLSCLLGALAGMDAATAVAGAAIASAAAWLAGPWLGWTGAQREAAAIFSAVLMLSTGSTASGMLRLSGRFDLLALAEQAGPLVRLIGSVVLWMAGGGLNGFLAVWALALLGEAAAGWVAALASADVWPTLSIRALRLFRSHHPGVLAFLVHNNVASAFTPVWQYGGVLVVGSYAGARAAGGLRLASKLAAALGKPVEAVTRALYPELAHLVAGEDRSTLVAVLARVVFGAGFAAVCIMVVAGLFGGEILRLLYGPSYVYAAPVLRLLAVAAAIDLAGAAAKPFLNAHGASGRMMTAHMLAAAIFATMLFALVPGYAAVGAGWATIIAMLVLRIVAIGYALPMLRQPNDRHRD